MTLTLLKRSLVLCTITLTFIMSTSTLANPRETLTTLETSFGGKLGVYAINTANNESIQYHANRRFPFGSTCKVMVVAAVLKASENNPAILQQQIKYTQKEIDIAEYAPITKQHLATGMSVIELSQAAIEYSDNTAMNLLTEMLGGPNKINAYAKSIHDNTFRLDRLEPKLGTAIPGDLRDTTTPLAMGTSLQHLTLGDSLKSPQRENLQTWLKNNTTGYDRIRAGTPKGWTVGDKTGRGDYGTDNDIAVIWPPKCAPIVIAVYTTQNKKDAPPRDDVIAVATRIAINDLAQHDSCLKTAQADK